jgi:formylmethanofuran dehydrogenase subunit C
MGMFEKLIALSPLQPYLEMEDSAFIEDAGWRDVLRKVKQLKDSETIVKLVREASPVREKEKIVLGYLCTLAAEEASGPVELPCVDYAGCYLSKGVLILKNPVADFYPGYVGMGMNAASPQCKIVVEGHVGDYLGFRAPHANLEVKGSARDRVAMAVGQGDVRIEGDVAGGLGGNTHDTRLEVDGDVGRINRDHHGCTIIVSGDVHWGISENQADCFIKVCGNVGLKYKKTGKMQDIAAGLTKNSVLLVGGDVYGNLGKRMELAKIFVWGRVYGEIEVSDTQGGFIYLNKKSTPFLQRMKSSIGGAVGIKYATLKESGYLFAEGPEDVKGLIVA